MTAVQSSLDYCRQQGVSCFSDKAKYIAAAAVVIVLLGIVFSKAFTLTSTILIIAGTTVVILTVISRYLPCCKSK